LHGCAQHPWFKCGRIVIETPEVRAQLDAQAALLRQLRRKDQELAQEAQAKRSMAGPRGALIEWAQRRK
jgi:hypothetical protein